MVEKLWGFEDFSPSLGMLSAAVNAGKSDQNCPKLPKDENLSKSAQRWNFEIPPKIEILVFFKNKNFYV
jgi:hypothetical protein